MEKRLLLLRHAKSDWSRALLSDLERPLNARGRRDAACLGRWIAASGLEAPARIIASPARRVQETLTRLLPAAGWEKVPRSIEEGLYLASESWLLARIRALPDDCESVMLVGHNPGLEALLVRLSRGRAPVTASGKIFTTANLACIAGPDLWREWQEGDTRLTCLVRPKMLDCRALLQETGRIASMPPM